jgi:hypothetical protein
MSTASESTSTSAVSNSSNPFDPTPLIERLTQCSRLEAEPQKTSSDIVRVPRLIPPVPHTYAANYAAFSTAFLSPFEIENHWEDTPVLINNFNSEILPENQFLDTVGRVCVYEHFKTRITRATVIDFGSSFDDPRSYRFFATYSQLMDTKNAYIRIVSYNRDGFRCQSSHPEFGNFILVVPRELDDVIFPDQLRFHAMHVTDTCHNIDEAHHRIRLAADKAFTPLERVWWDSARCGICDSDL